MYTDVNNNPNTNSRVERVKEKLYLLQPINFCIEFSSTLLVPFAVLVPPAEGYHKSSTVRFFILVPFTTSEITAYRTVTNRSALWKRAIIESIYYMSMPKQYLSVLMIFNSLFINIQSS